MRRLLGSSSTRKIFTPQAHTNPHPNVLIFFLYLFHLKKLFLNRLDHNVNNSLMPRGTMISKRGMDHDDDALMLVLL